MEKLVKLILLTFIFGKEICVLKVRYLGESEKFK